MSLNTTASGPLPNFWERAAALPYEQVKLPPPRHCLTRHLSPIERATVKCSAPLPDDVQIGNSILHEAALRLAIFQKREILQYMSGSYIADAFQRVFWKEHPSRHARRGWSLLAELDRADIGVEVWISGEPLEDPYQPFRRMRLSERITELEVGHSWV